MFNGSRRKRGLHSFTERRNSYKHICAFIKERATVMNFPLNPRGLCRQRAVIKTERNKMAKKGEVRITSKKISSCNNGCKSV